MLSGPRLTFVPGVDAPSDAPDLMNRKQDITHEITRYTANAIDVQVETPSAGWVIFNEVYFPGWMVSEGGHVSSMTEVAGGLRAVYLSGGPHRLNTNFRPTSLGTGAALSCGFLVLGLIGLVVKGGRKATPEHDPDLTGAGIPV